MNSINFNFDFVSDKNVKHTFDCIFDTEYFQITEESFDSFVNKMNPLNSHEVCDLYWHDICAKFKETITAKFGKFDFFDQYNDDSYPMIHVAAMFDLTINDKIVDVVIDNKIITLEYDSQSVLFDDEDDTSYLEPIVKTLHNSIAMYLLKNFPNINIDAFEDYNGPMHNPSWSFSLI